MKLGTENKKKTYLAIALAVVAILLFARSFLKPTSTSAPTATQAANGAAPKTAAPKKRNPRDSRERHIAVVWAPTLDPRLRLDLLEGSEGRKYEGAGRNIFREHMEEIPKPIAPGMRKSAAAPAAPWRPSGPPPPPPINLKFSGWASQAGGPKAVFLTQGDEVFVAQEGDIVAHRYKVLRIDQNSIQVRDVLNNNTQTIPMSQG